MFANLDFCLEHFISIKYRILATFIINKKFNSDSLCAFNLSLERSSKLMLRFHYDTTTHRVNRLERQTNKTNIWEEVNQMALI
jgi:hypothetical protein